MTHAQLEKLGELGMDEFAANTSQTLLIRSVQVIRGSEPCFATDKRHNCVEVCEWSGNCRKVRTMCCDRSGRSSSQEPRVDRGYAV